MILAKDLSRKGRKHPEFHHTCINFLIIVSQLANDVPSYVCICVIYVQKSPKQSPSMIFLFVKSQNMPRGMNSASREEVMCII